MKIGFFSPEIENKSVEDVFAYARSLGYSEAQYDFLTTHGEEMPPEITKAQLQRIRNAADKNGIQITCVNGTFNMVDSNPERLAEYIRRFELIADACRAFDCGIISLCTGSKHPDSEWIYHEDNKLPETWAELIKTTRALLEIAERYDVCLGVETEPHNVICEIDLTKKYLEEIDHPRLGVILDAGNLFNDQTRKEELVDQTILHAFEAFGDKIILAHGKDIYPGVPERYASPGKGMVNYDLFLDMLKKYGYQGGMILHGIHPMEDFEFSTRFIREKIAAHGM